jgi:uncharacterized protein (TIGR00369 family)
MVDAAPNAARFAPLPADQIARWAEFPGVQEVYFPGLVGLRLEEVRRDYARMRLPYRPELRQPGGVVHGGALATLIDTVVVPAIAGAYHPERRPLLTISLSTHFLAAVFEQDALAEGWVERRGRSVVFCRVEVRSAAGELSATASVVYKVGKPLPAA